MSMSVWNIGAVSRSLGAQQLARNIVLLTCMDPKFRFAPGRVGRPAASAIARMDCSQAAEHQKCGDHEKKHAGQKEPVKVKSPEKSSSSILII